MYLYHRYLMTRKMPGSNDRRIENKIKVNMLIRCGRKFQAPGIGFDRPETQRRDKRRRWKGDAATSMREEGRPESEIAREKKRRSGSVFRVAEVFLIGFLSFFFFFGFSFFNHFLLLFS